MPRSLGDGLWVKTAQMRGECLIDGRRQAVVQQRMLLEPEMVSRNALP